MFIEALNKTENVRLWRNIEALTRTIFAVEKQYYVFSVYVCSLSYPARKAHAPYYIVICGMSGFTVFSMLS
jgi:hypothetical protein